MIFLYTIKRFKKRKDFNAHLDLWNSYWFSFYIRMNLSYVEEIQCANINLYVFLNIIFYATGSGVQPSSKKKKIAFENMSCTEHKIMLISAKDTVDYIIF